VGRMPRGCCYDSSMGRFLYGRSGDPFRVGDRVLAHLEAAIGAKLGRGEPFLFTLRGRELPAGEGARSFWMHPGIALQFQYDDERPASLNRAWVELLVLSASSNEGLRVMPEPAERRGRADDEVIEDM